MAINGSGTRDTARVLKIDKDTVTNVLKKKENSIVKVNQKFQKETSEEGLEVSIGLSCEEAEIDEQWSFVQKKSNQRWIWYAIDNKTNTIFAYVFEIRKYKILKK